MASDCPNLASLRLQMQNDLLALLSLVNISHGYLNQAEICDETAQMSHMLTVMRHEIDRITQSPLVNF